MNFTQVKLEILKKLKRAGVKNIRPNAYQICIRGLRVFDEKVTLEQIYSQNEKLEMSIFR